MGSLLTITEVATRLGRHKRSVHNYIEKGFLRRVQRNGRVLVPSEEVEQLAVELGTDFPAMTRKTFFQMQARLADLERKMLVIEKVWGVQERPLRPTPQEAAGLLRAATQYLSASAWKYEELSQWATLFNQIDEDNLTVLAESGMTVKPWETLFQLATRMLDFVDKAENKNSLELQALRTKMEMGRRKVREAALLWIEMGRGTVPDKVFALLDTPKESLLRALTEKPKQKRTPPSA